MNGQWHSHHLSAHLASSSELEIWVGIVPF